MANQIKSVSTGYVPRPLQRILHASLKRFNVIVCHRRWGKTVFSINEMVDKGLSCQNKSPQYAYIAPTYGQAKRVAWDILKDTVKNIPGVTINEAELRVDIPRPALQDRIRFMLLGAENPGSIRGIYLDGVILDEYAEADPIIWSQVVRPALSDRLGWAIFIGTPKGQNGFYEVYQQAHDKSDWFHVMYRADQTNIVAKAELEAAAAIMSPEEFQQEFLCSFSAALVGAYYGKYMQDLEDAKKITAVPHDPAVACSSFWDLGIDDSTVIWIGQRVGKEWHFIDHIEMSGEGLDYYVRELKKRSKYTWDRHYLPHDAAARDMGTGKSRVDTLKSLGLNNIEVLERTPIEDGINAVRMMLPKCWFDSENCKKGIAALKAYQRKWDSKNKIYQQRPLHDWSSHSADAFRTFAMSATDRPSKETLSKYPRKSNNEYDIFGG